MGSEQFVSFMVDSWPFIRLFAYWTSIFPTMIALGKIKGSVKLFKSIFRNWKAKRNNSFQRLFQDCLTIILRSWYGISIPHYVTCIVSSSYFIHSFVFRRKMKKKADWIYFSAFFDWKNCLIFDKIEKSLVI